MNKPCEKSKFQGLPKTLLSILVAILLAIGTLAIYLASRGYTIDISRGELEQTGILTVRSYPRRAYFSIDGEYIGKTSKSVTGLSIGTHTITVNEEGYWDWNLDVYVGEEQSIPIDAYLFKQEPLKETIHPISETETPVSKLFTDSANQIIAYTTISGNKLQVWTYPVNRRFWEFELTPQMVAEISNIDLTKYSIQISPDAQKLLVTAMRDTVQIYFVLNAGSANSEVIEIPDLQNSEAGPTWSMDSRYIIFSRNRELRSYNLDSKAIAILSEPLSASDSFIWTSTATGYIYTARLIGSTPTVERVRTNGENRTTILELSEDTPIPQENDPASTPQELTAQISEAISDIQITPDSKEIILFHETGLLVYDIDEDILTTIEACTPTFLSFSPDGMKFLYTDNNNTSLKEYTLSTENGHPLRSVGSKTLIDFTAENHSGILFGNFVWHPSSTNVFFTEISSDNELTTPNTSIRVVNTDSLQIFDLVSSIGSTTFAVGNSGSFLLTLDIEQTLCKFTVSE